MYFDNKMFLQHNVLFQHELVGSERGFIPHCHSYDFDGDGINPLLAF